MHPNDALASAEREILAERPGSGARRPPPPAFLHFAPRDHGRRRSMTAVLTGYFDFQPSLPPIPRYPDLTRLARTKASKMAEMGIRLPGEELDIDSTKKKKNKRNSGKDCAHHSIRSWTNSGNSLGARPLNKPGRGHDDSSVKRNVEHSEDSTPPLTPLSSESGDLPFGNSHNVPKKTYKKEFRDVKRAIIAKKDARLPRSSTYNTKELVEFWRDDRSPTPFSSSSSSEDESIQITLLSKKRKRESEHGQTAEERAGGRKRKHGWKGWVVVEGSPPPAETLIKLDEPKVIESRTRSGKIAEPRSMIAMPRRRRTIKLAMTKSPSAAPQTPSLIGDILPSVLDSGPASVEDGDASEAAVERVTLVQDTQEPWYVNTPDHGSAPCSDKPF